MPHAAIRIRHPAALRTANAVGTLLERCGIAPFPLDATRILDRAEWVSGFALADPMPRNGLAMLVRSLESEAGLSVFGKFAMRSALQRAADSRHRVERAFAETPEIADEPILDPVFIVGAPRSGTTILHALLHLDRGHRAPLSWECLLPYPAPRPNDPVADKRIDTVQREFDRIFRLVPDFRKKHYMEADSPQECLAITALNFTSFQFLAQAYLPSYHEWFVDADQERNLRWHRRFLQFLQSGGVRRPRWLLKSPVHLMRLRELFAVYPDARVIVTHRHPERIVPSTASMVSSMRSLYSDHEDTSRTGREQLRIWADYFNRFLRDRSRHLFHLLQVAVDFYLHNDPLRPKLMPLADQCRKLYGDNVDAVYYFSQVRGDQEYVISGQRFDSCYLGFCLYGGDPNGELADRVTLNVNHRDIGFADDGTFEIRLTPNPSGPNEFPIAPDSVSLLTREYFFDRPASRESTLRIRNASPQGAALPLDDAQLARRIRNMATFFQCTTWIAPPPVEMPVNEFCPPFEFDAEQGGWGTVDNIYCFCRFRLEPHQYLKITFRSPEACYWGLQTWNYLMQSTNYLDFPVCVNNAQAVAESDGRYEIYLGDRPAPRNWISTAGYREGILFARWLLAEALPETPLVEVGSW